MKLKISLVTLKNPVFVAGTNFPRFDGRKGEVLTYDRDAGELYVEYNGAVGLVPVGNISNMMLAEPSQMGFAGNAPKQAVQQPTSPQVLEIGHAQVSTPFGHVHEGLGKGKSK